MLSSDPAECNSEDKYKDADWTVQIFTDWNVLVRKFFISAKVYLLIYIFFAIYPEEHDTGKTCTKGADVNGKDVHPV